MRRIVLLLGRGPRLGGTLMRGIGSQLFGRFRIIRQFRTTACLRSHLPSDYVNELENGSTKRCSVVGIRRAGCPRSDPLDVGAVLSRLDVTLLEARNIPVVVRAKPICTHLSYLWTDG